MPSFGAMSSRAVVAAGSTHQSNPEYRRPNASFSLLAGLDEQAGLAQSCLSAVWRDTAVRWSTDGYTCILYSLLYLSIPSFLVHLVHLSEAVREAFTPAKLKAGRSAL